MQAGKNLKNTDDEPEKHFSNFPDIQMGNMTEHGVFALQSFCVPPETAIFYSHTRHGTYSAHDRYKNIILHLNKMAHFTFSTWEV